MIVDDSALGDHRLTRSFEVKEQTHQRARDNRRIGTERNKSEMSINGERMVS
jgi:hypothetical protein